MKKFLSYLLLSAAALVALSFAACTDSDVVADGSNVTNGNMAENAISFSTYMSTSGQETRATAAGVGGGVGAIDTDVLKQSDYGFGVFAYFTGKEVYGNYRQIAGTNKEYPNFMYNEKITWNIDKNQWEYSPIKYWPNEIQKGDVDDQNNDTSNDPAQGGNDNGGNVSFFAYAPYVASTQASTAIDGANVNGTPTYGIIKISSNDYVGAAADAPNPAYFSDPYLTYVLPPSTAKPVDLLWGTTGKNGVNVVGKDNKGVTGNNNKSDDAATDGYVKNILGKYTVNADLTKQTTLGTVDFAFKHALAKIGGSYTGTGIGDDEDGTTPTNGLLVILDIDKNGAEFGGSLEAYKGTPLVEGSEASQNKYNTKVTINEITLKAEKQLTDAGATALTNNDLDFTTTTTYTEDLVNKGIFNLATGQWTELTKAYSTTTYAQTISASDGKDASTTTDGSKDAILSKELAEPATHPGYTKVGFETFPIGVTTVAKNVYETEAQPFVFIPGTRPIVEISITYTVRTYDDKLKNYFSEVKQKITKNLYITDPVELNKQYNILMHLGLTSVKFTATVSDWETTDAIGTTTDPGSGQSPVTLFEDEVEHVYLPINVGEPAAVVATLALATGADASLDTKTFTTGSAAGVVGKVNNVVADEKNVQLSHVLIKGADWITYNATDKTFSVLANTSPEDRTAKLQVIYDNRADETWTVTQKGVSVQNAALTIYKKADFTEPVTVTENVTVGLASASTTYYTKLSGQYQNVDKNGDEDGTDVNYDISEGYTITLDNADKDNAMILGTKIITTQNNNLALDDQNKTQDRTMATGVTVTYGTKTTSAIKVKQNALEIKSITLTVGGATESTISATANATRTVAVMYYYKDSAGRDAGKGRADYSHMTASDFTFSETWLGFPSPASNVFTVGKNTTGVERTATVTFTKLGVVSNAVTITQLK